jgi:hypothetical protein
MTWQFAEPETLQAMCGEDARYFDPKADYTFSPVSSNIEQEYNKAKKIQNYDQAIGRLTNLVQVVPEIIPVISHMITRQLELQGDEYQDIGEMMKKLSKAKPVIEGQQGTPAPPAQTQPDMLNQRGTNQYMYPLSPQEEMVRGSMKGFR